MNPEDELQVLREEAEGIKGELEGINRRIQELESKSSPS
jgi:prefoldin subunit 5